MVRAVKWELTDKVRGSIREGASCMKGAKWSVFSVRHGR